MPRKTPSKSSTSSARVRAKSAKPKTVVSHKASESSLQERLGAFFSSVGTKQESSTSSALRVKRKYLLPLLGLVLLLVLAWLASRYLVVAWVDKRPITRFDYYKQLDKKYGKDLKEQLIVETLIDSEAQKRGVSVNGQEITNEIKKIETEQGGASQLDQVLQMQGISRDELKKLVRLQLLRQKMFASSANITDNEINSYIAQNKASLPSTDPNDASAEANLKNNVRQQLMQQKLNATFSSWLKGNLNSDRVIRL